MSSLEELSWQEQLVLGEETGDTTFIKECIWFNITRSAELREARTGRPCPVNHDDKEDLLEKALKPCHACNRPVRPSYNFHNLPHHWSHVPYGLDLIVPHANPGCPGYCTPNTVTSCYRCNKVRGDLSFACWAEKLKAWNENGARIHQRRDAFRNRA